MTVDQVAIVFLFLIVAWLALIVRSVVVRVDWLSKNVNASYREHKKDAKYLEMRIDKIEPNQWIDGKRPVPIRPAPMTSNDV